MITLGASVTLTDALTGDGSTPADPESLTLELVDPAGAVTTLLWPLAPSPEVITRLGLGRFSYTFTPDQVDIWRYVWTATGAVVPAALDGTIEVESVLLPQTYATIERAVALFETRPNAARLARLAQELHTATDELVQELDGRDYFRHPDTGTLTWSPTSLDLDGSTLHVHGGVFDVASITVRTLVLDASEYVLRGPEPTSRVRMNEPAFHIELTRQATIRRWPRDPADTVIVSATGWPAIPPALVASCAARARQLSYGDGAYGGVIAGPDGDIPAPDRWPQVFYRFLVRERTRFAACLFSNDTGIEGLSA